MANKELTLKQRLDDLVSQGKEIKVTWEGGNDSGGYDLFIDDVKMDYYDDQYDAIVNPISDAIDYGSWAGDFSADGSVVYDPEQEAFVGEGRDVESEGSSLEDVSIEVRVPKALNFDSVEIHTEGTFCWDELNTTCRFGITNGPVFPEHTDVEDAMETHIRESITHLLETHDESRGEEVGWVYNEWSIPRESFKEDGDHLVAVLDTIDYTYNNTKHQSYHIPINED